jgi:hypothetical protein
MLFKSFLLAGFEGSTGYNLHRQWIDQVEATQHDRFADEDYWRLTEVGIRAARESVRWSLVDRNGFYDFSSLEPFIRVSQKYDVEIIYDLFHFGYPDWIDLFSEDFPKHFAEYCYAVAGYISENVPGTCYFTPVNEPSYFSWAAGEVGLFAPHAIGRGYELKAHLIKAAIQGINAIHAACPRARIVNVDPICYVSAPHDRPDMQPHADGFNRNAVYQSWDMLSGRLAPELGGSLRHLDIVGVNYYWTNQWELGKEGSSLSETDPRRRRLSQLVDDVWQRYGADILITETSHVGDLRHVWLEEVLQETEMMLKANLPVRGVCLYPILGMPEWHQRDLWTQMGLWDMEWRDGELVRCPYAPMMEAVRKFHSLERRFLASFSVQSASYHG